MDDEILVIPPLHRRPVMLVVTRVFRGVPSSAGWDDDGIWEIPDGVEIHPLGPTGDAMRPEDV